MDVVTIGETMVLFTPVSSPLIRNAETFSKKIGGSETNVAVGLARLGHQSGWISKVGADEFGKSMLMTVRGEGVDISQVKVDPEASTGMYFKETRHGGDVRVHYYRKNSAASKLSPSDLNEEYIAAAKYLHITGITPALSDSCYQTVLHAISIAKKNNVQIIFDPNLRKKLWEEDRAREVLKEIAAKCDIILPGVAEGEFLFNEKDPEILGKMFLDLGAKLVVLKVGAEGAYYFQENECELVPGFIVEQVIDPVGAGDGFAAGFISGLLEKLPVAAAVAKGNAVGAMVTMIPGDFEGLPDKEELQTFMTQSNKEDIIR